MRHREWPFPRSACFPKPPDFSQVIVPVINDRLQEPTKNSYDKWYSLDRVSAVIRFLSLL
jgi:hypothetical protein